MRNWHPASAPTGGHWGNSALAPAGASAGRPTASATVIAILATDRPRMGRTYPSRRTGATAAYHLGAMPAQGPFNFTTDVLERLARERGQHEALRAIDGG